MWAVIRDGRGLGRWTWVGSIHGLGWVGLFGFSHGLADWVAFDDTVVVGSNDCVQFILVRHL